MVKISVIIPVYNTEKYLKECLDSIVNQTFTDIEIICINDGSSDGSLKILNEYENNYGPLTYDGVNTNRDGWSWVCGPWPWEGED